MLLNPFVWSDAVDPADAVSRGAFTTSAAGTLKAGTHVALFGPRGTGKTTFIGQLASELAVDHSSDAPPWELIRIDLRRVISPAAFIGAVVDAARDHSSLGRRALSEFRRLEKEIGINLGVVKAGARQRGVQINDTEILHAQLSALSRLSPRLVIAFDEFQRLAHCPGEPLSIIRSALMGPGRAGHLTLLLTGSLRDKLRLMLHTSTEPIWDQTHDLELPDLDPAALADYLEPPIRRKRKARLARSDRSSPHAHRLPPQAHPARRVPRLAGHPRGHDDRPVGSPRRIRSAPVQRPRQHRLRADHRHAALQRRHRRQRRQGPVPARRGRLPRQREGRSPLRPARQQSNHTRTGAPARSRLRHPHQPDLANRRSTTRRMASSPGPPERRLTPAPLCEANSPPGQAHIHAVSPALGA